MVVSSHGKQKGSKLPRGPHRLTTEEVSGDQRERLIDAMVRLAGARGYAATTVADVIGLAQVSRKTFYEHFPDREALLLAAFDTVAPTALEEARAASRRSGGTTRQFEALMRRLCRFAGDSPGAVALYTIEIAAADPDGLTRREELMGEYGALIDECMRTDDEREALPSILARAPAGGTHRTIDAYMRTGRADMLASLAPQLARWVRSYHPVPAELAGFAKVAPSPQARLGMRLNGLVGGRAPGTLTLSPQGYEPPFGRQPLGFAHHSNRERILDAVAQLTTGHGYTTLTAQLIFERADVSERSFLAHFRDKDEAFYAAAEVGHMKGQAIVERARERNSDWRIGTREAVQALVEFLASEPYFTRLAFVDAPLAGPKLARRTQEHANAYARLLLDDAPRRRRPPKVAPEAIVHGVFELAFHYAAEHKVEELLRVSPLATYLTMAPFLGVSEAADLALASA